MNAKDRMDIIADALATSADEPMCVCDRDTILDGMATPGCPVHAPADKTRCKCNPPGPVRPVGVAVDGNGRTTVCRVCNGTGWIKEKAA